MYAWMFRSHLTERFLVSLLQGVLRSCLEAELVKEVSPGDSDSVSSGVFNSGFEQLLGEVTGFHVDNGIYFESQLSLGNIR